MLMTSAPLWCCVIEGTIIMATRKTIRLSKQAKANLAPRPLDNQPDGAGFTDANLIHFLCFNQHDVDNCVRALQTEMDFDPASLAEVEERLRGAADQCVADWIDTIEDVMDSRRLNARFDEARSVNAMREAYANQQQRAVLAFQVEEIRNQIGYEAFVRNEVA